MILEVLLLIEQ